jgi:RNA methyltransferase, TrmH family
MISKQQQKYVQSLHNKKYRNEFKKFLVEGEKGILELVGSDFEIEKIYCTEDLSTKLLSIKPNISIELAKENEIEQISTLRTNKGGVAIVNQKTGKLSYNTEKLTLVLDDIKDPGNLGTIIRLADWYGVSDIICSPETVEFYNPKVIMATMGSFSRVNCHYISLVEYFKNNTLPVYGAFLEGKNVHIANKTLPGILVIGSESHGIGAEVETYISQKLTIPRLGHAESLNAGVATGILLDNFFRDR